MNYRKIGDLIQLVDQRNKDLAISHLVGLTINKKFIPSVANTIGTDMANYKLIRKNQFACSTMQVRRDKKMPIALLKELDIAIISQAYPVFEVIDENVILPDYLMLWFSRSEFDREACFHAVGGVRGSLEWEDFCGMQLPVPSIEEQRQIVAQYQSIANKIKVNGQICEKLEATAQALYKHWFVDFEFPNEEGKPYKSSDGKMVWNEELGKEIPEGWEVGDLEKVIEMFISKRGKSKSLMNLQEYSVDFNIPVISAMNISNRKIVKHNTIPFINIEDYNEWMEIKLSSDDVIMTSEAPLGETYYIANQSKIALSQRLFAFRSNHKFMKGWFLYFWLNDSYAKNDLLGRASGTTVMGIKLSELKKIKILIPEMPILEDIDSQFKEILKLIEIYNTETQKLTQLQSLLLSRLAVGEEVSA
ncbi:restriction endonuclease subunit S [Epilithonimonas hominis]|uniref:Type I restriction enzyme, S subunit n=1 Tax=Epilithonimonas hominis TaxID=420404 RepID=A0A1H6HYH9_9FLAO|nr:restriction endonuclease subunit S [Epilithonimonas hominis]SEH39239.1 type I restriction enzyme, S subunit [Epilithonimonas hominis]